VRMRSEVFQKRPFLDPSERFEEAESLRDDEDEDQNMVKPSSSRPSEEELADEIRSLRAEFEYQQAITIRDDLRKKVQALRAAQNNSIPTLENANVQRHQQRNDVQHQHNDERQNVNDARIPLNNVRNQNANKNININQFDRQPMQLDRFRQLVFDGIPGYPNAIDKHLRLQVPKFSGNNTVSGEDHLKAFQNVMDNFEVEHEDVFMKSFM